MRFPLLVLVAVLLAGLVGCAPAERAATTPEPSAVADRDFAFLVSADRLSAQLGLPNTVVLHVGRDRSAYDEGHVPGARFLPLSAVAADRGDQVNVLPTEAALRESMEAVGVSDGSYVVVYGDMNGLAAARAFFALDVHGHPQVAVLDGGLDAWRAMGGELSTDEPTVERGQFTPRLRADVVVDAATVNQRRAQPGTVLVDARPEAQHTGADPGPNIPRPGHIPGSVNLFWQEDLREDGTMRPLEELHARYAEAGVTADREVITYCRTGVQASHAYLVARLLRLEPRIYDGSFHDWSNNTDYPVATGS